MSSSPLETRVVTLEQAMTRLALAQANTEKSLEKLTQDTQAFHDEMRAFKDEMRASNDRADRRWGELANKMGTLVEDIVAPGIPAVFQSVFRQEAEPDWGVRLRRRSRRDPSRRREFDGVAWGGGVLLVIQTKSALAPEDIGRFLEVLGEVRDYFPEAEGQRVVGALASFYVEPSLVLGGDRQGLLMLGLWKGLLEVLNSPGFTPRSF
jgi:hypothetical protein